jgi:HTH-type transcriptional regulator / antitoxin HigA
MIKYQFEPDYAVPPGATLKETLDAKGLTQTDLCARTGMSDKVINQIVNGVAPITLDTADKLELAIGVPATFWNRLELGYREALARTEAAKNLESDVAWLKEIPVKELIERGYIDSCEDKSGLVRQVLRFFGVSNVDAWRETWAKPAVQYRGGQAQKRHPGKVAAWLRMGEIEAERIPCGSYDPKRFRESLIELKKYLDRSVKEWYPAMIRLCAEAGVAVVFIKEIPGASLSGATKWISKDKAILMLSLKYKTDDQVWFSFFHEAVHIVRHGKKQVFIEDGEDSEDDLEREADTLARETLIPNRYASEFPLLKSRLDIERFAKRIGVSSGIVVGRLQMGGFMPHSFCNDLKVKLQWPQSKKTAK